jgi:hypothetical protein
MKGKSGAAAIGLWVQTLESVEGYTGELQKGSPCPPIEEGLKSGSPEGLLL